MRIFNPFSKVAYFWDLLSLTITIVYLFLIPFILCFQINILTLQLNLSLLIYFLIKIVIQLNTGIYFHGNLITKRNEIFNFYIKNDSLIDFLTLLPLIISIILNKNYFLNFLILFRVIKLPNQFKKIEENQLQISTKLRAFYDLMKLLFYVFYTAHISACIWHLVAILEMEK